MAERVSAHVEAGMTDAELWRWDAVDLAKAIKLRRVSSRDAVDACLARIEAVNPKINAVTQTLAEEARGVADAADAAVKRGDALGPLHGVPVLIKENIDQKGLPTVNGVRAYLETIAKEDSPPVANWRKAGAVIIGRTNTPGFSLRWHTDNEVRGRTYSPWARDHTPGGSSGGAGAALATGMAPLAHGNDYGGSIRYPSYCCGTAGIRPSLGRVPAYNPSAPAERPPTAQLMSVQGPMARRVRDVRLGLAAMAARDVRDPWWVPAPLEGPAPARPIRVALCLAPAGQSVHPAVRSALEAAGKALAAAGYAVEEGEPPDLARAAEIALRLMASDVRDVNLADILRLGDEGVRKAATLFTEAVPSVTFDEYRKMLAERAGLLRQWLVFLETTPLILGPVSADPPYAHGFDTTDVETSRKLWAANRMQYTINFLGLPSVAVPAGRTKAAAGWPDGLPLGVQVIASRYREDLVLDAAEVIEATLGIATPIDPKW